MTPDPSTRWPTVAEVAQLIAAWLPEATGIDIYTSADGDPGAVVDLPGLSVPVVWMAQAHAVVMPHPWEDSLLTPDEQAAWGATWDSRYAGRPTRPAAVWRWRLSPPEIPPTAPAR